MNLQIQNFKCFRQANVYLNHLTVLAGANGFGKSSVIQALLLLKSTTETLRSNSQRVQLNNPQIGLNLGVTSLIVNENADLNGLLKLSLVSHDREIHYSYPYNDDAPDSNYLEIEKDSQPLAVGLDLELHYISAERIGPRLSQELVFQEYPSVGHYGEHTGQVLYELRDMLVDKERCSNKEEGLKLERAISSWIEYIFPTTRLSISAFLNVQRVQVRFKNAFLERETPASNIAFGVSYALPILVAGLTVPRGSMLVIENPEAHLHPAAQSNMGRFLAQISNWGIRVLIETHSEHIIRGLQLGVAERLIDSQNISINFFSGARDVEFNQPYIQEVRINPNAELTSWPEGFFDESKQNIIKLFRFRQQL